MPGGAGREDYSPMPTGSSGADWGGSPSEGGHHPPARVPTYKPPKQITTPDTKPDGLIDKFRQADINRFVKSSKKAALNRAMKKGLIDRLKGRGVDDDEVDYFDVGDIKTTASRFGGDLTKTQTLGLGQLRKNLEFEDKYPNPTQTQFEDYYGLNQPDTGGGGGEGGQIPWWLRQQAPVAAVDDTTTASAGLGSGHFQVPIAQVLNQTRAAEGGIIGSVGGTSRQKYQGGEIVGAQMEGAEMEGAEMEGAMMQSKEVIKELYDALIAQGLSPQEAMEKIKEIIASSQAQEPESPMMGEEFPGQEFSRAPAAFGGIMDTYTGRRKYGLGSFIKKGIKKIKKLASSKLGKLALMYAAGTYLGGTQAFGGTGQLSFADRLRDPKLLANLINPTGGGVGEGKGWSMFQKTAPIVSGSAPEVGSAAYAKLQSIPEIAKKTLPNVAKSDWSKYILPASIAAGAYTAAAPVEGLDDTQGEWDKKKEEFDAYLASLDTGDSYRVPENLRLAQGGRIGRQEGGLMNLGGMEKDYRNDGGFVPLGGEEKADDVPARLSKNEFVFTADAVRNAGGGDIDRGAEVMENVMKNLEGGGKISEESQGQGAQEMFEVSERLSEVV